MGTAKRKFRIEMVNAGSAGGEAPATGISGQSESAVPSPMTESLAKERHHETMDAIEKLNRNIANLHEEDLQTAEAGPEAFLDKYKSEIKEAAKLKRELDLMQAAIARTKSEIVSLRYDGATSDRIRTVTDELDEVVAGTEGATEAILSAAEVIDTDASTLTASLSGTDAGLALEIQEQVIAIFEACNFQDITGQRINKVVTALRFIEERVESMLEIWGESSFEGVEAAEHEVADEPEGRSLANGPSMPEAADRATQDEIDALFD